MRVIDVLHMGREKVIGCFEMDGVLIDPGPESCVETLLEALGDTRPRALLLTHIHFDHAGASGALVRRFEDLEVYVHEKGAPHLADPGRLVASATRLYGEDGMKQQWGEVVAVPQENLRPLQGGETVLGDYRVTYTPGHASHHVTYFHEPTRTAFVGDTGGVRVPPSDYVLVPTPPPDIDIAAWDHSLDAIAAMEAEQLGITHFGVVDNPVMQIAKVRAHLLEQAQLAHQHDAEGFAAAMRQRLAGEAGEDVAGAYMQAAHPDHLYQGLRRWWDKQSGVSSAG